jgi:hypothetical protein
MTAKLLALFGSGARATRWAKTRGLKAKRRSRETSSVPNSIRIAALTAAIAAAPLLAF